MPDLESRFQAPGCSQPRLRARRWEEDLHTHNVETLRYDQGQREGQGYQTWRLEVFLKRLSSERRPEA